MQTVIIIYLFKALVILVGMAFVYMGYKLFIKGITAPAGSFTGEVGDKKLKLLRFAPGIFFALVGTVVVVVGSTRKFSMKGDNGLELGSTGSKASATSLGIEVESAGNPPPEADAGPTDPAEGEGAGTGQGDATGHTATTTFSICDTCDVP